MMVRGLRSNGGEDKIEATPSKDDKSVDIQAGVAIKATLEGVLYGNAGMPGGMFNFTASEVSSPFYLLGQLINAFAPPWMSVASDLRDQDYNRKEIVHLIDEGADLEKVSELKSQDVSHSDINYYVGNDMWLGSVSKLQERGVPPSTTKKWIKRIKAADNWDKKPTEKKIEILNRGWTVKKSTLEILKGIVAHDSWQDARSNSQPQEQHEKHRI